MKKRVLILIAIPNFNFSNENSAVLGYLKKIKKAFEGADYEVVLDYTSHKGNGVVTETPAQKKGVKAKVKSLLKKWPWFYQSLVMKNYFKSQNQLFSVLQKMKPCDLVIEFHSVGSTIGRDLARLWNAQLSVIFDSPVDEQFEEMYHTKSAYWSKIQSSEKDTLTAADKVMVYSPACEDYIKNKYGLASEINILPCVLTKNSSIDREPSETFHIGFIGSFLSWHKVELLVEVFKEFHLKYPDAKLSLIGFGNEWGTVKEKIDLLNLSAAIDLPGFISEEDLIRLKSRLTVAVMPGSNWYGSPLKLFEYAESGIPFIAPDSKTVRSIFIEDQHCLYIDSSNEKASLFSALEKYYSDIDLRNRFGENAKVFVESEFADIRYAGKLIEYLS